MLGECVSHLSLSCNRASDGACSSGGWLQNFSQHPIISTNTPFCGLWWIAITDSCTLSTIGWCPHELWSPNYCYTSWSVVHRFWLQRVPHEPNGSSSSKKTINSLKKKKSDRKSQCNINHGSPSAVKWCVHMIKRIISLFASKTGLLKYSYWFYIKKNPPKHFGLQTKATGVKLLPHDIKE